MRVPVRYRIVSLLFAGSAVNFIDRVNIAVAAPAMMHATGWQKDRFGLVFSAFLFGYALMQIPAGYIADRRGARRLLAAAFCGFSLFTALTPLGVHSIIWLLLIRCLVGACEASTFPAITAFNTRWFPPAEFGRAQTISLSGGSFGQMVAYPLTAWVVLQLSWPSVFYISAGLGFIWVAAWLRYSKDSPGEHPAMSEQELKSIAAEYPVPEEAAVPMRNVLTSVPVLVLSSGAMCFAFVLWTFLFWFPTYLIEARGLSLSAVGEAGIGIQACGFLGTIASGIVSDRLFRKTGRPRIARTGLAGVCITVAAGLLLSAVFVSAAAWSLVYFGLFFFFLMTVHVAFLATPAALYPRQAATIFGMVNCCASIGAVFGPVIVGFLMAHTTDWRRSFEMVAGFALLAGLLLFLTPVRRLDGSADPAALS
jgi:MFS family permease